VDLTTALPRNVAPKKVENGTRNWPHIIPAKSNSGLGICNYTSNVVRTTVIGDIK